MRHAVQEVWHSCVVGETDDQAPKSVPARSVRAQVVAGLDALDILGEHLRRRLDYWPVASYPGLWLALDVRTDFGVAVARLTVEDWRVTGSPDDQQVPRSWPVDLPWDLAAAIGRSSDATRQLREVRNRLYWTLEASKNEIHLADQNQIDLYLASLPRLARSIERTATKAMHRS